MIMLDLSWQYNISFDMENRRLKLPNLGIVTLTTTFEVLSYVIAYVYSSKISI